MAKRPPSLPIPTTWHRFAVHRGGKPVPLRVQDLTEELKEPALAMLQEYFTRDEPPCKYIGIKNHPTALSELTKLWRKTVDDQLSVVCVEDRDDELVLIGVNVLTVTRRSEMDEPFQTDDKIWAKLFGAVDLVTRGVDIFQHFGVEEYLSGYGMVVDPAWRGLSIGKEILRARIPLCKALNIKITATVFTAAASQAVAKKAGFTTLFELSYEDLAAKGFRFPGVEQNTKSSKLMVLVIE